MTKITLYTTDRCPYCVRAKALLTKRALSFEEINLSRDADGRAALSERTGMLTFPQILVGDTTVGGFAELVSAEATRDGGVQAKIRVTVEIEGQERPACVVETLSRYYPADAGAGAGAGDVG